MELVIASTEETVVALAGIQAYPAGFGFTLCLRLRNVSAREEQQFPYLLDRVPCGGDPHGWHEPVDLAGRGSVDDRAAWP